MTHLTRLISHLEWADAKVLTSLRAATTPAPAALELYAHVLGAEQVWLARLEGGTPTVAVWPALSVEECAALAVVNAKALWAYVAALQIADLDRGVAYRNSAGQEHTSTIEDILLHVALHGAYHRGQIARALRQGGAVPEPTDYIAFTRGAPAATRRSS